MATIHRGLVPVLLLLSACAHDLSGNWRATYPSGQTADLKIQRFGDVTWYLSGEDKLAGVYEQRDDVLICVKPNLPPLIGFSWREQADQSFVLISEPPLSRIGDQWLGTTLRRTSD